MSFDPCLDVVFGTSNSGNELFQIAQIWTDKIMGSGFSTLAGLQQVWVWSLLGFFENFIPPELIFLPALPNLSSFYSAIKITLYMY